MTRPSPSGPGQQFSPEKSLTSTHTTSATAVPATAPPSDGGLRQGGGSSLPAQEGDTLLSPGRHRLADVAGAKYFRRTLHAGAARDRSESPGAADARIGCLLEYAKLLLGCADAG